MEREGPAIPAATRQAILRGGRPIGLVYSGDSLEPLLRHGRAIEVDPAAAPGVGELILCRSGGRADVRRVLSIGESGTLTTALDAVPGARERIAPEASLGVLRGVRGPAIGSDLSSAECSRCGHISRAPPAGCGAGSEVFYQARRRYRVTGFDLSAGMVAACRDAFAREGVAADILQADLFHLDLGERMFEAVYFTPLVYSFLPGWSERVRALQRLGCCLAPSPHLSPVFCGDRGSGRPDGRPRDSAPST